MPLEKLLKSKSYYELLEVSQDAGDADIKRAYRHQALKFHPDRRNTQERRLAELRFRLINEAYAHLKTAEKRALYNRRQRGKVIDEKNLSFWAQISKIFKAPQQAGQ